MKSLFILIFSFSIFAQAQTYVPVHTDSKNIIVCDIYDYGYTSVNYYLQNGMLTYSTYSTYDPVTKKNAEVVVLPYSTMSALDPFGANKQFSVVGEDGKEYLKLSESYKNYDSWNNINLTYYSATFNNSTGTCTLQEDAPPNAKSNPY